MVAAEAKTHPGRRPRDLSDYKPKVLVAPPGRCAHCGGPLTIQQHRERPFQTTKDRWTLVLKDRRCSNRGCPGWWEIHRPPDEWAFRGINGGSYGVDILEWIGRRRQQDHRSFREIHDELQKLGIDVSRRHVPNLFRLYLCLVHCQGVVDDRVRGVLRKQGRVVLAGDAVRADQVSPPLYVVRDVLSGEFLLAARIESPSTEALAEFLAPLRDLDVPVDGIIVDKEAALGAAFRKVLPDVPLQFCQTHYLKNLTRPIEPELATLQGAVKDTLTQVREVKKALKSSSPDISDKEREFADVLVRGAEAMGKSQSGDKLFEPPRLRRFLRLDEMAETLRETLEKKGGTWPLLFRLLAALSVLADHRALARRLERQFQVVRDIANILNLSGRGEEVSGLLKAYLVDLVETAPRRGCGAAFGHFVDHVEGVSGRFWSGLFHCYDIADLPRNNNALEQFFNVLKRHARRIDGRQSTAGGPIESFGPFLLMVWNNVEEYPSLQKLVRELPPELLRQVRDDLEGHCEPARQRRAFLRAPRRHVDDAVGGFLTTD